MKLKLIEVCWKKKERKIFQNGYKVIEIEIILFDNLKVSCRKYWKYVKMWKSKLDVGVNRSVLTLIINLRLSKVGWILNNAKIVRETWSVSV